jgi:hypothetical protein
MNVSLPPEASLKTTVQQGFLSPVQKLQLNAAILLVVTILILIAVLLFWIHLRGIWSHHSFAINDYIKDNLLTSVKASLESILLLNDLSDTSPYPAHELYIDDSEKVESRRTSEELGESCEKQLYSEIRKRLPSLDSVTPGSLKKFSANIMLKEVITATSPPSSPVSKVLLEALKVTGSISKDMTTTYTGLLMLLTENDIRLIQNRGVNVGTMDKMRTYVTNLGVKRGDAALAYIGGCINDKNNGASNHTKTARILSRALCGTTDLINLMKNVVPQAKELYDARQKKSIPGVFWLFYRPYFVAWTDSIVAFFRNIKEVTESSYVVATVVKALKKHTSDVEKIVFPKGTPDPKKGGTSRQRPGDVFNDSNDTRESFTEKNIELIKSAVSDLVTGKENTVYIGSDGNLHRSEGFFKAIANALKFVPKFLGILIKFIPKIFSMLIKILVFSVKGIIELVKVVILFFTDPLGAVKKLFTLLFGVPYLVLLVAVQQMLVSAVVLLYAVLISLPTVMMNTLIAVLIFAPCIVGAILDYFLNGMVRVLARTENHPEAWWYNSGFESYNINKRAILSFSTCSTGYNPNSLLCIRRGGCLNESCSAGMLMRAYRTGRYRHLTAIAVGQKLLPSVKKGCRGIVAFNSMKCNKALYGDRRKINLVQLDGASIKDMVRALCLTRNHMLPGTEAEAASLAKHATYDDPIAKKLVGVVTDTTADLGTGMKTSTKLGISVVAIVILGLGIQNMVRLRSLTGSLVSTDE